MGRTLTDRSSVAVVAAALAIGCGARTELAGAGGAGQGGNGPGTASAAISSSSSGGTGGGGGAACSLGGADVGGAPVVEACSAIQAQAQLLTVGGASEDDDQPSLVVVANTAPSVALIYSAHASDGTSKARVTSFDAWGSWPPQPSSSQTIHHKGPHQAVVPGRELLATAHASGGSREFALMYEDESGKWTSYAVGVTVCGQQRADATGDPNFGGPGTPLTFVPSSDLVGYLGASSTPSGAYDVLSFSASASPPPAANILSAACATTPISAGAVATASGWIVGTSAGTLPDGPHLGCQDVLGPIGPATLLTFATASANGANKVNGSLAAAAPVASLVLIPSGDGARAIWSLQGQTSLSTATLDPTAALLTTGELDAGSTSLDAGKLDAAPLGLGFAVAAPTMEHAIHVALFDSSGAPLGSAEAPVVGSVDGRVHVVAAPDGSAFLVAWSERVEGLAGRALRVARFDCAH